MNCSEFKKWLVDRDTSDSVITGSAQEHARECDSCRQLIDLDDLLEARIRRELVADQPPEGLLAKIEMDIASVEATRSRGWFHWKPVAAALAVAAVMVIFFNPFTGKFRQSIALSNLEEVASLAAENHRSGDYSMVFNAEQVIGPGGPLAKELGFSVELPAQHVKGLKLLGGRTCKLGKCRVAYLFYEKNGRNISLFVIHPRDIAFHLEPQKTYRTSVDGCSVTVWKEADRVYANVI